MDPKLAKDLKINLNAAKRTRKEVESYEKELEEAIQNVKSSSHPPDSYEHKKLVDLREESEAVLNDCKKRAKTFADKLRDVMNKIQGFDDDEMVKEAKAFLAQ